MYSRSVQSSPSTSPLLLYSEPTECIVLWTEASVWTGTYWRMKTEDRSIFHCSGILKTLHNNSIVFTCECYCDSCILVWILRSMYTRAWIAHNNFFVWENEILHWAMGDYMAVVSSLYVGYSHSSSFIGERIGECCNYRYAESFTKNWKKEKISSLWNFSILPKISLHRFKSELYSNYFFRRATVSCPMILWFKISRKRWTYSTYSV